MNSKFVFTHQCPECRKFVQVEYSCAEETKMHKTKVLRSLEIFETNCRNCNKPITENGFFYSSHADFDGSMRQVIEELREEIRQVASHVRTLHGTVCEIEEYKKMEKEKYPEEDD